MEAEEAALVPLPIPNHAEPREEAAEMEADTQPAQVDKFPLPSSWYQAHVTAGRNDIWGYVSLYDPNLIPTSSCLTCNLPNMLFKTKSAEPKPNNTAFNFNLVRFVEQTQLSISTALQKISTLRNS